MVTMVRQDKKTQIHKTYHLLQTLGDEESGLFRVDHLPALEHVVAYVQSDIVSQVQRSHRVTGSELHGHVDIFHGGVLAIHHGHGLREVGDEQPVHYEAWRVAAGDGSLLKLFKKFSKLSSFVDN